MAAPEIAPDFARLARAALRRQGGDFDHAQVLKNRKSNRLLSLRVRHRGTTLERVDSPVEVRVVRSRRTRTPSPALLLVHGGGYVGGRARMDDRIASLFARELGITVVSVEYRLAPEHPFPAGRDDCYAALTWLHAQPWVDRTRIAVGGASAGGGLAAALAQHAHDLGEVPIAFQLLVYPMLDDRTALRTDVGPHDHPVWDAATNRAAWQHYLGVPPGGDDAPVGAAPSRRADLTGLPSAWIGVGTADLFHDEDVDYAERLREAGVPCTLEVVEGAIHGFERFAPRKPPSRAFLRAQVDALRTGLGLD